MKQESIENDVIALKNEPESKREHLILSKKCIVRGEKTK